MAKIPFTKLGLSRNTNVKEIEWNNQKIEIKQYLPVGDKLDLISKIINLSGDEHVFYNPCKVEIFETIEIILAYTNINLTDKQAEDVLKLYDLFISTGFAQLIKETIPEDEFQYIDKSVWATIQEIYRYKNSFAGIIEQTQVDYTNLDTQITDIEEKISNPENLTFLKDVVTKLG